MRSAEIYTYLINMKGFIFLAVLGFLFNNNVSSVPISMTYKLYQQQREQLMKREESERIGSEIKLTDREQQVNQILMAAKDKEINISRMFNGSPFPPAIHFFHGKSLIEKSQVFQLIKKMPKGGALHLHDCSMTDLTWLVKNVTYRDHCYMCTNKKNQIYFHFFQNPPPNPDCPWNLVVTERQNSGNVAKFDQMLYNSMSLVVDDPMKTYPTIDAVWTEFLRILDVANGLINYTPVFGEYFYEALKEFRDDNVQYLETRGLLPELYNLDGTTINNKTAVMQIYKEKLDQFVKDYPDFVGGRIIRAGSRFVDASIVLQEVKESIVMMKQFPNHFVGYDLVGQEDPGKPLIDYVNALLYPSQQTPPANLPYFFHAGETDWEGTQTDKNLVDAVLLNTSRIGHGYALPKHPEVMRMVKNKNIAVEVNPISNQVLKLVDDLRNHPAATLIAQGFPVVISADDPSVWGARGLSYDFYMTFMGLAGKDADLTVLKKLTINSLRYSALPDVEKRRALFIWERKWNTFLEEVLENQIPSGVVVG